MLCCYGSLGLFLRCTCTLATSNSLHTHTHSPRCFNTTTLFLSVHRGLMLPRQNKQVKQQHWVNSTLKSVLCWWRGSVKSTEQTKWKWCTAQRYNFSSNKVLSWHEPSEVADSLIHALFFWLLRKGSASLVWHRGKRQHEAISQSVWCGWQITVYLFTCMGWDFAWFLALDKSFFHMLKASFFSLQRNTFELACGNVEILAQLRTDHVLNV